MSTPRVRAGLVAAAILLASPTFAQNVAYRRPVIDGNGAYPANPFYAGQFNALQVTDGVVAEPTQNGYWLGTENFVADDYFTLDLGDRFEIDEIALRNTHNSGFNDRGTADFEVWASDAVTTGRQLVNPTRILAGTLSAPTGGFGDASPITVEVFNAANGLAASGQYRYLQFKALSAHYPGGFNNPGLNEIEVAGTRIAAPDPGPNVALGKPVVASSGSYPFLAGFDAQRVTDGSTTDEFQKTYWLTADNAGAGSYLVVDLEGVYDVTGIGLRNTHNSQYNDRNTQNFVIRGSDTLGGDNLASAPVILSGGLPNVADQSPIELFQFGRDGGLVEGNYRYLRFEIVSAINNNGGLNELEVYGTLVPEPAALGVLLVGASVLLVRRRR